MPTRSSPNSVSGKTTIKGISLTTNIPYMDENPYSSFSTKWVDTVTTGDNIPGWRDKLRNGEDATTSLVGTKVTARLTNGLARYSFKTYDTFLVVAVGHLDVDVSLPTKNPATMESSEANAQALGKFNRRITGLRTTFQGATFLGELGQTIRMLRNPARGLRGLVDNWGVSARRIRGSRVFPLPLRKKKVSENLADAWLEAQFGWRPLLHDIDSAGQALARLSVKKSLSTRRITAKAESVGSPSVVEYGSMLHNISVAHFSREIGRCIVVYRGAVRVEAKSPAVMRAETLGYDPRSWAPTAWELIPYSFLIDYFTNVGDVIEGWSNLGTRLAWCNRTIIRSYEREAVVKGLLNPDPWRVSYSVTPAKFVCAKTHVSRASYLGTLVPDFTLEVPGSGSLKWLNIAALIAGRNSDRKWSYGD